MRLPDWYPAHCPMSFHGTLEQKRVYSVGHVASSFENTKHHGELKEDQFWGRKAKCPQREANNSSRTMRRNRGKSGAKLSVSTDNLPLATSSVN